MVLDRKIAFVDLEKASVKVRPLSMELRGKYLGGRGMNMYLLSQYNTSRYYTKLSSYGIAWFN